MIVHVDLVIVDVNSRPMGEAERKKHDKDQYNGLFDALNIIVKSVPDIIIRLFGLVIERL